MMSGTIKKICEALGISWVWWQWRWMNFKSRLSSTFSMDNNVFRRLRTTQKVCRCGALAASGDRRCHVCGNTLPSAVTYFFYRVFGLVVPGVLPGTALFTTIILADFAVLIFKSGLPGLLSPGSLVLVRMGALFGPFVAHGEWWRLFTCVFLHIGIIHLAFNMMALLSVSNFLEEEIGFHRYVAVYLLSGLGGSLASYYLRSYPVVAAGASGALFGLIGFAIGYFHRLGGPRGKEIKSFMMRWAVYGFIYGLLLHADNLAHAGGFVTGLAIGYLMEQREDQKRKWAPFWRLAAIALSSILALSFVLLIRG